MSSTSAASEQAQRTSGDGGTISLASPVAPAGSVRMLVTICTVMATLMQSLDSTIANVALP